MAAMGVLRVLHERGIVARIHWELQGSWIPYLASSLSSADELTDILLADIVECQSEPALDLAYGENGKERDLKAPPSEFAAWLADLAKSAEPSRRRAVDWAAAFGSEMVTDGSGKAVKPSTLHFTAGQQKFLAMVRELVLQTTKDDLHEALIGPWRYDRTLPVMGWDATITRDYALRATNPSGDKKSGVPGADWLAIRGLVAFPSFPVSGYLRTVGGWGGWKSGGWSWPLWTRPAGWDVATSLIALDHTNLTGQEMQARGVGVIFRSAIKRSDQGGYGSFSPPSDAREH
jgi:hypothetical protein